MSSDDEFDYMSDNFVTKCVPQDVRPGLIGSHSAQRAVDVQRKKQQTDAKNKELFRPREALAAERLQQGLCEAIGGDNRGFALLQKMGYKPGTALGKTGSGRMEPVPIAVKLDRQGLGREAAARQVAAERAALRQRARAASTPSVDDYRSQRSRQHSERQAESDLRSSQRACHRLDTDAGYSEPVEEWFWPREILADEVGPADDEEQVVDEDEDEVEEEDFTPSQRLEMVTGYLRQTYCYCVWCGMQYDDDKDLRDGCPGPTRGDH
ncbi:G patch domain-containing protein 11 [Bacillus rossius redtenbacheri]|uniref:G patch domain-containing protein 11 n=1 Tax=Bacillus rossius redtenbacheri TaxID=93214 RepID=UPI002FDD3C2D